MSADGPSPFIFIIFLLFLLKMPGPDSLLCSSYNVCIVFSLLFPSYLFSAYFITRLPWTAVCTWSRGSHPRVMCAWQWCHGGGARIRTDERMFVPRSTLREFYNTSIWAARRQLLRSFPRLNACFFHGWIHAGFPRVLLSSQQVLGSHRPERGHVQWERRKCCSRVSTDNWRVDSLKTYQLKIQTCAGNKCQLTLHPRCLVLVSSSASEVCPAHFNFLRFQ